jgi:4-amino-4-deoxy-L-arabinose transferase-like glycosyltransferase
MSTSRRRFLRHAGKRGNGNGGNGHVAAQTLPMGEAVAALETLDPASLAVLDLSLRWEMDDEQIASIGQTDVEVLHQARREAVQLVIAGAEVPPAEELEYVRRALAELYGGSSTADREPDLLDDLEATLLLEEKRGVEFEDVEPAPWLDPFDEPVAEPEFEPVEIERFKVPSAWRSGGLLLLGILAIATLVRLWGINKLGLNSDEAVYAGQGAAIANDPTLEPFFPAFRAHPLLFQTMLAIGAHLDILEIFGRVLSAVIGVATVYVTYMIGLLLYGRRAGLMAGLFMALMPYHVIVTRQILLDGPMVFFATLSLYLVARFAVTQRPAWLYAAGATMGLTAMSKETSLILLGAVYAFLALSPQLRVSAKNLIGSIAAMGGVLILFPISLQLAGATKTGGNYLAWQLFRRPNHDWAFYPTEVPRAIGIGVVLAAAIGLWALRKRGSWRETLLLAWIAVPVVFFQLWPVKGFQYLLPIAPAVALLAGRAIAHYAADRPVGLSTLVRSRRGAIAVGAAFVICISLLVSTWGRIEPAGSATFLAGSGGVPGGREAGAWIEKHVPKGAQMLAVGPSMANIVSFYGHRKAYGLSVSPNPLNRNPSYEPVANPDQKIRSNEVQYLIWDAFSASRSKFFSRGLQRYADRYHGRLVHTENVTVTTASGKSALKPVIKIYEVRP